MAAIVSARLKNVSSDSSGRFSADANWSGNCAKLCICPSPLRGRQAIIVKRQPLQGANSRTAPFCSLPGPEEM